MLFGAFNRGSKFAKFLKRHDLTQAEIARESKVSPSVISRLTQGDAFKPSMQNGTKILKALKKYDSNVDYDDFWSM